MESAIARRGESRDVAGVLATARRAALDIGSAIDDLEALPVPPSARRTVAPFRDQLATIERNVTPFRRAHGAPRPKAVMDFAAVMRLLGQDTVGAAERAGLRVCGREAEFQAAYEALLAPFFRDAFERFRVAVALSAADARRALTTAPPAARAGICDHVFSSTRTPRRDSTIWSRRPAPTTRCPRTTGTSLAMGMRGWRRAAARSRAGST